MAGFFYHLFSAFGIHLHQWLYFDGEDGFYTRQCEKCGVVEELIPVPAAPGGFTSWMRKDE